MVKLHHTRSRASSRGTRAANGHAATLTKARVLAAALDGAANASVPLGPLGQLLILLAGGQADDTAPLAARADPATRAA